MIDQTPILLRFSRLYWNQMGREVYGTIHKALRAMLDDGGEAIQQALRRELMLISHRDYADWFERVRTDVETIRKVGGRFILPQEVPTLLEELEAWSRKKPS